MTPSEKQKEIAVAFAVWLDQQRNDPTWKDLEIWHNNTAYQLLLNAWLLTEEGKRLTAEEPDPIDRLTSYELLVKISEQFDRFEGRLRGDMFRD